MKNQPGDKCFACKQASSSPRALYPASKEHWEAPSSLHFLRGSKSLWILFHGLQLNQFFVFSSIPILIEGQYLLHFGSTGCIKIWKGRLSIVLCLPECVACTMQENCSCVTWNFSLGPWVAGMRQNNLTAIPVSRELISAATPGSQGKQCKYSSLPMTAPERTTLSKHGSIFLPVVLLQQRSKTTEMQFRLPDTCLSMKYVSSP